MSLKDKKVGTAFGVAVICLFSVIYLAVSYYAIDSHLKKYGNSYYHFYVKK
jgi:hypothetical protein